MNAKKANPFGGVVNSRAKAPAGEERPERGRTAKRSTPVRITIDLDPGDYSTMRRVVMELGLQADRPTLAHSAVWRALLAELDIDGDLAERVVERIRSGQ